MIIIARWRCDDASALVINIDRKPCKTCKRGTWHRGITCCIVYYSTCTYVWPFPPGAVSRLSDIYIFGMNIVLDVYISVLALHMFLSCTTLYEWLSILFFVFVMHISVRMTMHIIFGFCHAHLCTNDYPYYFWFSSCTTIADLTNVISVIGGTFWFSL